MVMKRVFDNAQGRKPRGRGYGVCLELELGDVGFDDVSTSGIGVIDACVSHFPGCSVGFDHGTRGFSTVETIGNRQHRSVWSFLVSVAANVMAVIASLV